MSTHTRIVIVGAGPAALVLALGLARRGIASRIFERDAHPEHAPRFNPDRSYTIDITGHSMRALASINAMPRFDERLIRFRGIKALGRVVEPYDGPGWTGSRGDILRALMSLVAEHDAGLIDCHFQTPVDAIDVQAGVLTVTDPHGAVSQYTADLIVGGDGAGSLVRRSMAQALPDFSIVSTQFDNHCTMIELDRAEGRLDPEYLHILSARPMCVAGAINGEGGPGDPRWFCMVGFNHKHTFAGADEARSFLNRAPRLAALVSDASIAAFARRECQHIGRKLVCSHFAGGRAVLLGDAAAPFPPIGQGVNAAMESATLLAACIAAAPQTPEGLRAAAARYSERWKPEADAVSWIGEKFVFDSPRHTLRNALATQFGFSVFKDSKRADMSYGEARQAAERLGPLWR